LGAALGILLRPLLRRDSRRMVEHLAIAFPEKPAVERIRLEKACWRHLGKAIFELLHIRGRQAEEACRHVEVVGWENVEAARVCGKVVVILTGHCGNWELIATVNASHGLGLAAIAREFDEATMQDFSVDLRRHLGSETIARGSKSATRQLLRVVRNKGSLGLLIDQDTQEAESVFVPFFGRPAWTPTAATTLALRLGAAVVPTFSERLEDGSHRVTFHRALDLPPDVTAATAMMTAEIEQQIRRHPEQWVWMHRRWRRQPVLTSES
jgi:KDO2-lipid IV(A) lauroyltransferase